MRLPASLIFTCSLFLSFRAVAAQNLTLADTPPCALQCLSKGLSSLGSSGSLPLQDIVCPNITLQSDLSECVQMSCQFRDQIIASEVLKSICRGSPLKTRSNEIIVLTIVFSAVSFPIAGLKFYTRWAVSRKLDWDDYTALIATILMVFVAALEIASAKLGLGHHYWTISAVNGTLILKLYYAIQMFYILVQVTAKMSLLFLYIRVFPRTRTALLCKVGIAFLVLHGIIYLFLIIFQCTPIVAIWDHSITGKCLKTTAIIYSGAAFSILEDFFILILPVSEIRGLQIGKGKKWILFFMFSIGSFACVTSIIRLKYLSDFSSSLDATWDQTDIFKWSLIELFVALLCACIPSLRAFLAMAFHKITSSVRKTTNKSNDTSPLRSGLQKLDDSDANDPYALPEIKQQLSVKLREKVLDGKDSTKDVNSPESPSDKPPGESFNWEQGRIQTFLTV